MGCDAATLEVSGAEMSNGLVLLYRSDSLLVTDDTHQPHPRLVGNVTSCGDSGGGLLAGAYAGFEED